MPILGNSMWGAPSGLPAISPTGGEIGWGSRHCPFSTLMMGETEPRVDLPLVGEMPDRAEGGIPPRAANGLQPYFSPICFFSA
jgi:hypothetical protein